MILVIAKKLVNGRWVTFDAHEMYRLGEIITVNQVQYEVTQINGSKVTLEVVK